MIKYIHPVAGVLAILTIATFWLSTAPTELFGSHETITAVKTAIPWGFLFLILALLAAGGMSAYGTIEFQDSNLSSHSVFYKAVV